MAEETAFENGRIANFQEFVTLTLDRVILHTVMHHSSTFTYMPNFISIKETLCSDVWTFETGFIRSTLSKRRLNNLRCGLTSVWTLQLVAAAERRWIVFQMDGTAAVLKLRISAEHWMKYNTGVLADCWVWTVLCDGEAMWDAVTQ